MKNAQCLYFRIQFLLFIYVDITSSQQQCPHPDVPRNGNYFPKKNKFEAKDEVTYNCTEDFLLVGKEKSMCKSNGDWSNPTPFCDRKAQIQKVYVVTRNSNRQLNSSLTDDNKDTCFSIKYGEFINVTLDKPRSISTVRIFLKTGDINIEITNGQDNCPLDREPIIADKNRWILFRCLYGSISTYVKIQENKFRRQNQASTLCEIEVYGEEEKGCQKPPSRTVANGYYKITRSSAKLICQDGYKTDNDSDTLVCKKNDWDGHTPQCNEILCDAKINVTLAYRSEWEFVKSMINRQKITPGTKRKLKCSDGYKKVGSPDTIECQSNGNWTETNATCIEILCSEELNITVAPGSEWAFAKSVRNISVGTIRKLKCDDGYKKIGGPDIIVCQKNELWTETNATCKEPEILCTKELNVTIASGSEWALTKPVKIIFAGTTRKLKCDDGYKKVGGPDTIVCEKNGFWTETNATCIEMEKAKGTKKVKGMEEAKFNIKNIIIYGAVGLVVVILSLSAITIYCVKKRSESKGCVGVKFRCECCFKICVCECMHKL